MEASPKITGLVFKGVFNMETRLTVSEVRYAGKKPPVPQEMFHSVVYTPL